MCASAFCQNVNVLLKEWNGNCMIKVETLNKMLSEIYVLKP
jgi:hypothetical protein